MFAQYLTCIAAAAVPTNTTKPVQSMTKMTGNGSFVINWFLVTLVNQPDIQLIQFFFNEWFLVLLVVHKQWNVCMDMHGVVRPFHEASVSGDRTRRRR
jgi:hypothetical protein